MGLPSRYQPWLFAGVALGFVASVMHQRVALEASPTAVSAPAALPVMAVGAPAAPSVSPAPPASPSAPARITLAFAGDVHGEPPVADVLALGDDPLAGVRTWLEDADLAVVNLETAVGSTGERADKQFTFQADPALLEALADAGVDVVSLANNHALDYGRDALMETMTLARAAGLHVVGAGRTAQEAYAPAVFELGGRRVAVVGLSGVLPTLAWTAGTHAGLASAYDEQAAIDAVVSARMHADLVVVAIHWGAELDACPNAAQLRLARALLDAGADVIAGSHPHVLQPIDAGTAHVVAYSLGNFVFYNSGGRKGLTGVLRVHAADTLSTEFLPARIDAFGRPQPADEVDARDALAAVRMTGAAPCRG